MKTTYLSQGSYLLTLIMQHNPKLFLLSNSLVIAATSNCVESY